MSHRQLIDAKQLQEARRALLDEERRLLRRVAHLENDLRWLDENVESEIVEEAQERSIAGLLERLDEQERAEIGAIERALERIDRGTYGICVDCGEPIRVARQLALPTAETCLDCRPTPPAPKRA